MQRGMHVPYFIGGTSEHIRYFRSNATLHHKESALYIICTTAFVVPKVFTSSSRDSNDYCLRVYTSSVFWLLKVVFFSDAQ